MTNKLSIVLLLAAIHAAGGAVPLYAGNPIQKPSVQKTRPQPAPFTDAERALIAGSRKAIVQTGMSEGFFDQHFKALQVVDKPGDRRIVWRFLIDGYETKVADVLGYYTQNGKRVDTHSVATTLRASKDIEKTISRRAANQAMRQCIGNFRNASIEFRASDTGGTRLVMIAESIPKTARRKSEEEREREERARQAQSKTSSGRDPIESEGHDPPIITGTVDLQTGKCTKGELVVAP